MMEAKQMAQSVAESIKAYVAKRLDEISERLSGIEADMSAKISDIEAQGRESIAVDIVDMDEFRSYSRGTLAHWKGGIIYAFRKTDTMDEWKGDLEKHGWTVALNGFADVEWKFDDDRILAAKATLTDGSVAELKHAIPTMLFKGVWQAGEYEQGDVVSKRGSMWHCNNPTSDSPGTASNDWTLCVKEGRPGRAA